MSDARRVPRTRSNVAALTKAIILNLDILRIILSFLPRVDILSVSRTSRFLREWAIKELLFTPIDIDLPNKLESWCRFVLADENRPAYVRDLSIRLEDPRSINNQRAELLLTFLQRATRLRRLYVGSGEAVFGADPGIPFAISRLPALESFEVDPWCADAQETSNEILMDMKSRLKVLSLHVAFHLDRSILWTHDIPRVLAPHREHLQELRLEHLDVRVLELCYPSLRTLKIPVADEQPRPSSMFQAFPGLRHLSLSPDLLGNGPFSTIPKESYPALRHSRQSEQSGGRVWSSLDTLRGPLMQLYVVGLACPVRRLEIQGYNAYVHDAAVEIVRSACPQKLVLDVHCRDPNGAMIGESSLLWSGSPDRQHVTHLTLRIHLATYPVPLIRDPLNDLVPLLRNSKVEYLRLVIGGSYIREDRLEDELIIERWLREHLRAMKLDLLRDTLRVWTAERSGGTATITEVDPVDARELIRREEA
ncbi:hypothetical protein K466DRAFT_50215 [Polyporus arcularius HHB13444]|uniref:F-box domain-containing protein n=1 Tax=Polyporus arcularius HHB13444 TaxID=1314778 RepID=A0A5C3PIP2_9APHY|nr:hypothetical protein K466DRAFT_50215 [Polyporus arcularius HHB13444]